MEKRGLTRRDGLQDGAEPLNLPHGYLGIVVHVLPALIFPLCSLAHELRVSCMQRKKVQIQSSDPSSLASDRYNLILVSGRELSRRLAAVP